jgi:peptidoglycan hydrolase-like protein with peptidoglycan-binding domain
MRRVLAVLLLAAGALLPAVTAVHAAPDDTTTTVAAAAASSTTTTTAESATTTTTTTTTTVPATTPATTVATAPAAPPEVTPNAAPPQIVAAATCTVSSVVQQGSRGAEALCAEQTLAALGLRFVGPDDTFGVSTANALKQWQRSNGLAADGIVGEVTGTRLGIWVKSSAPAPPPPTPPTTVAPPVPPAEALPANSGSGRRVVYSRAAQRVWAVEADGTVVKTHRVSGRLREPYAGTYHVYSRSMYTYSTENPDVKWRYMVRFTYGPGGGRIGFHEIPSRFGVPLQSEAQLGQPLSGGCVRQKTSDAQWMWNWAGIGTTVVVL